MRGVGRPYRRSARQIGHGFFVVAFQVERESKPGNNLVATTVDRLERLQEREGAVRLARLDHGAREAPIRHWQLRIVRGNRFFEPLQALVPSAAGPKLLAECQRKESGKPRVETAAVHEARLLNCSTGRHRERRRACCDRAPTGVDELSDELVASPVDPQQRNLLYDETAGVIRDRKIPVLDGAVAGSQCELQLVVGAGRNGLDGGVNEAANDEGIG